MAIITIGNFDGVHLGHQALIRTAREIDSGAEVVAVTFDTHPASLTRSKAPGGLTDVSRKTELLKAAGATRVDVLPTSRELLALEPRAFIEWLRGRVPIDTIVEGTDFRFGKGRSGDIAALRAIGAEMSFEVRVVDDVDVALHDAQLVSVRSSTVRWLLEMGRVADARLLLGRTHRVSGVVVKGAQRGRQLGFPTANLSETDAMLPRDGVYGVEVRVGGSESMLGAASVGTNPTFGSTPRTLEVHVLEMAQTTDIYGQTMSVDFLEWIRPMMRFEKVSQLIAQMERDCQQVAG